MNAIRPAFGNGGSGHPYRFTARQVWMLTQIAHVQRLLASVSGGPTTEFVGRIWDSLEETGTFRETDGPVVITLPWPPEEPSLDETGTGTA